MFGDNDKQSFLNKCVVVFASSAVNGTQSISSRTNAKVSRESKNNCQYIINTGCTASNLM